MSDRTPTEKILALLRGWQGTANVSITVRQGRGNYATLEGLTVADLESIAASLEGARVGVVDGRFCQGATDTPPCPCVTECVDSRRTAIEQGGEG